MFPLAFDEAPQGLPHAAGIVHVAPDGRILLLRRAATEKNYPDHWALPGGGAEANETPEATAERETLEEMGTAPDGVKTLINQVTTPTGAQYYTYTKHVGEPFTPTLNAEHSEFAWVDPKELPEPMHPAVATTISEKLLPQAQRDVAHDEWEESKHPRADNGQFGEKGSSSINMSDLKQVGGRLGSNPGGQYKNSAGDKFYVKHAHSEDHARSERLAAELYGLAGSPTLDYVDVDGGKNVATRWQEPTKKSATAFSPEELRQAQSNFATHAWLANWDAAGLDYDNQAIVSGKPTTVDVGGSLEYRAQGGPKGEKWGDTVGEWETLRDPSINRQNAKVFGGMTKEQLRSSAERVVSITDEQIKSAVSKFGKPDSMAKRLIARRNDIAKRAGIGIAQDGRNVTMDHSTVRSRDADGHLRVAVTPISKANVCPYYGSEIPNSAELGLDPRRMYRMLRHPDELIRGASSFAGKPLMLVHKPINSSEHPREIVVGAVGEPVAFDAPYLRAPLTVWDGEAIGLIETNQQRELSAAYRYRADMTPGIYNGEPYDGIMRDIAGNHVALVREGRAGRDVVVGDEKPKTGGRVVFSARPRQEKVIMSKTTISRMAMLVAGALTAYLTPRLAQDAQIDITAPLADLTAKNFKERKDSLVKSVAKLTDGKLAKDANIADLAELLNTLSGTPIEQGEIAIEEEGAGGEMGGGANDATGGLKEKILGLLKGKLSDDDLAAIAACFDGETAMDEDDDETDPPLPDSDKEKDMVDKTAMDAAIKQASEETRRNTIAEFKRDMVAIRAAEKEIRPYVGELAIAQDSAAATYRAALKALGVADVDKLHDDALRPILLAQPKPGAAKHSAMPAMDAAAVTTFTALFPTSRPVKQL